MLHRRVRLDVKKELKSNIDARREIMMVKTCMGASEAKVQEFEASSAYPESAASA
jgi:hypothetical protein